MGGSRGERRIADARADVAGLGADVDAWRAAWDDRPAVAAHTTHLDTLGRVLHRVLGDAAARVDALETAKLTEGATYDGCRQIDVPLLYARRLWRWYADKLDPRLGNEDEPTVAALAGADEVVWSVWRGVLAATKLALPPAPLPYVAAQESASATPPETFPAELRPAVDPGLQVMVDGMPIPTIAVPPACVTRPWWLVLLAHETGHQIQFAAGAREAAATAMRVAVGAAGASDDVARQWEAWSRECFADACSVLTVGPAALWSIAELEERAAPALSEPRPSYPSPIVRLAFLDEVAGQCGIERASWLLEAEQTALTAAMARGTTWPRVESEIVAAAAAAMLGLDLGAGVTLAALSSGAPKAFNAGGVAGAWAEALQADTRPSPEASLEAARLCVAGAVAAVAAAPDENARRHISAQLLAVLPACREPGTRADKISAPPDADAAADAVLAAMYSDSAPKV